MQGRSNAGSARGESDPYQVMSLKLCRGVFATISRFAHAESKGPSVYARHVIEAAVAKPVTDMQHGWAVGDYVPVAVRMRESSVARVKRRSAKVGMKPSQYMRAVLEDHVLRSAQSGGPRSPVRRAG